MRLKTISEIMDFKAAVAKCSGHICIKSSDGTELDLESTLQERGSDFELFCDCKNDEQYFFRFFMDHPEVNQ